MPNPSTCVSISSAGGLGMAAVREPGTPAPGAARPPQTPPGMVQFQQQQVRTNLPLSLWGGAPALRLAGGGNRGAGRPPCPSIAVDEFYQVAYASAAKMMHDNSCSSQKRHRASPQTWYVVGGASPAATAGRWGRAYSHLGCATS